MTSAPMSTFRSQLFAGLASSSSFKPTDASDATALGIQRLRGHSIESLEKISPSRLEMKDLPKTTQQISPFNITSSLAATTNNQSPMKRERALTLDH